MKPATHRIRRGLEDLGNAMYRERRALHDLRLLPLGEAIAPRETPIPDGDAPGWRAIAPGDSWGGYDQNAWFHGEARIPPQWTVAGSGDTHAIALRLLLGVSRDFGWPEGLLYVNGRLLQGINQHHPDVLLPDEYALNRAITFDVRAWSGMLNRPHRLEYAEIALLNREVEALYHLLLAGCDLVDALEENEPLLHPLWQTLEDAWDQVDLRRPTLSTLDDSASEALAALRARLADLRARYDSEARPAVVAIGHGHLDVAWLWQTRHTREKAARTFSIGAALMDRYPEYHFLHTTPQVFAWLADDYPEVFARAKQRIAEGRFEAAGALWLETDTNIVSGESLVRQIVYGQRYLRETFGSEYDALWLPDTFGYSYALPQIMLRAGLRAFMTTKMSWSDTNRIPYDTFRWRGLDGSETLAHFVTTPWLPIDPDFNTDTYNARLDAPSVLHLWRRYRSKPHNQELLLIYGHGDGGAGPTRQHIESYRALRELPGLPTVTLGRADEYFHRLRERVWNQPDLPRWDGELYLEYHRGVYTTQAWLKRLHRRIEERLLLAESLDAARWASARKSGGSAPDERATLDDAWRMLLLHEFHDILPGSSIGQVYADARESLTALAARLDAFTGQAERDIAERAALVDAWLIHNPSPVATPGGASIVALTLAEGEQPPALINPGARTLRLPMQVAEQPDGIRVALYQAPAIEGRGWLALRQGEPEQPHSRPADLLRPSATAAEDGGAILENTLYRLTLNAAGEITSLLDKRVAGGRELMQAGRVGNQFIAFEDRPRRFDAWDIDAGYTRKPYALETVEVSVTEHGPLRASVRVRRRLLGSVIEQDISLYAGLPRIDFATRVDWRQHHLLLKVAFPLDLRVTQARSEIQYGSISRPTHENTSWDQARFETIAHRWVDLSEGDYGVALLNDGRYGHDIHENDLRLTVLRSPTSPDPEADQGAHEVTFSLLPHLGAWPAGDVIAHGYTLNRPPCLIHPAASQAASQPPEPASIAAPPPLFAVDAPAVVVEAVKRAAEGDDLIVRLYESTGSRVAARVTCAYPIASVVETDLLERPLAEGVSPAFDLWHASPVASHDAPETDDEGWRCQFRPFEIRTFRATLRLP